jgi:hypothetical protein
LSALNSYKPENLIEHGLKEAWSGNMTLEVDPQMTGGKGIKGDLKFRIGLDKAIETQNGIVPESIMMSMDIGVPGTELGWIRFAEGVLIKQR